MSAKEIILKIKLTAYKSNWDVYIKDQELIRINKNFSNAGKELSSILKLMLPRVKEAVENADDDNRRD